MADSTTAQKIAAEVLGTFVLVFFGCGSVAVYANASGGSLDIVSVGLTFGLAVAVMAYAVGRISGGHFNPAVTVGAAMGGRVPWRQVPVYVGSQLGGAIAGGLVLFVLLHGFDGYDSTGNMGQNSFGDQGTGYAWWAAFLLELVLTMLFVTVILATTDARFEHPSMTPLIIGLTLAAIHFVAIPATGTSVNPARSIGPALFAGTDAIVQLWLFILAPLLGGAAAGLLYPLLFGNGSEPVPGSRLSFAALRSGAQSAPVSGYGAADAYQQEWNQQAAADQAAWEQEPIIQDGWQWDHAAQEWKPLEQWQPATPATPTPGATTDQTTQMTPATAPGETTTQTPAAPASPTSPASPASTDPLNDDSWSTPPPAAPEPGQPGHQDDWGQSPR